MRQHKRKIKMLVGILAAGFIAANAIAFRHAYLMTHFSESGLRTARPEGLTVIQKVFTLINGVNLIRPQNKKTPASLGLSFETHSLEGAFGLPLEAWLIRHPKSKGLIVMFHSYAASKEALLTAAGILHRLGYETLLVDFYGSGGSGGNSTSIGFHEAIDVAAAMRYARKNIINEPPILYGVSMGAVAILRAIHTRGLHPKAVILEAPFDSMLNTISHRFAAMGMPSFPGAHLLLLWGSLQNNFNGFSHNPVEYAGSVNFPTLLMAGTNDSRVREGETKAIYEALAGPKKVKMFPGLGHQLIVESDPKAWELAVGNFLSGKRLPGG